MSEHTRDGRRGSSAEALEQPAYLLEDEAAASIEVTTQIATIRRLRQDTATAVVVMELDDEEGSL